MKPLYMLELEFKVAALFHFLHSQGLSGKEDDKDLGYGVHAWLGAALGQLAPKPWRLFMDKRRPPRILAYSAQGADTLRQRIAEFAPPRALEVCPQPHQMIADRLMPKWQPGRRLGFQTLVCPVGRKARSGVEKDLFLLHADAHHDDDRLSRETIYCHWAREQFNAHSAAINSIRLAGFRLVKQIRQTQLSKGKRTFRRIIRPQALLEGELTINEPDDFDLLLRRGLGRHRGFGYGMILLRPPS